MRKAFLSLFLLVLALAISQLRAQSLGGGGGAGAAAPPTTQELQQMLDAKQYPDLLRSSQRALAIKGPAAKDVDRFAILMIRGEAYLQLKQQSSAIQAYTQAGKETTDPTKAGVAKAMVTLLQKSHAFSYTPKPSNDPTKPSAPLNLLDPNDRKMALAALFDDEWKPTQAKIDAYKKQGTTSLVPILQAASLAGEMRGLELAATGDDKQTSTALSDLTDSAAKLMTDYLDRETRRLEDIDRAANLPSSDNINETSRRGLTAQQATDLKDITATCEKLTLAADQVAASAGPKGSDFHAISDRSKELGKRSYDVLTADYSSFLDPNANRPILRGGTQAPMTPNTIQRGTR